MVDELFNFGEFAAEAIAIVLEDLYAVAVSLRLVLNLLSDWSFCPLLHLGHSYSF